MCGCECSDVNIPTFAPGPQKSVANNTASRGFSAIEVAIFMIAATVVATISAVGLMTLSGDAAQAGVQAGNDQV